MLGAGREMIRLNINRFLRIESHYCKRNTKREYLHPDLRIKKIGNEGKGFNSVNYMTYGHVFQVQNLSFHHHKTDQCSLSKTYREGDDETKKLLKNIFREHIQIILKHVLFLIFNKLLYKANENSIVAAMLLHSVCTLKNIKAISLRFLEPFHGQSEGDSAQEISIQLFEHCQIQFLIPVFRLARHSKPFIVNAQSTSDFLNYKAIVTELRILTAMP
ncbi:hypothetical protein PR048_012325, partial [Dryococelus australis]